MSKIKMPSTTILMCLFLFASFRCIQSELVDSNGALPKGTPPFPGSPWPMPHMWTRLDTVNSFDPWNYTVSSNLQNCDLIEHTLRRLRKFLQSEARDRQDVDEEDPEPTSTPSDDVAGRLTTLASYGDEDVFEADGAVERLNIIVHEDECPRYPQQAMKEDYNLTVSGDIVLEASSAWGVIRGLTTLGQLLYTVQGKWYINDASVEDAPRFPYRGLHLDTARHFYHVGIIKRNLDVMSAHKLNVFHWHMVDNEAFPFRGDVFPELAEKGAFSPRHTYSRSDVEQVIDYARLRGIRVIPEFVTPGHAHSWGQAKPDLLTSCDDVSTPDGGNTSHRQARTAAIFDPSKNSTFLFLEEFFTEIKNVFPDDFLHIGLDDTFMNSCWVANSDIAAFMSAMEFGEDLSRLKAFYDEQLMRIIQRLGKTSIIYEDSVSNGVLAPDNTVVHQWRDTAVNPSFQSWQTNMADLLRRHYHVISTSCWSLNTLQGDVSWQTLYACDPADVNVTIDQLERLLGGEARPQAQYMDPHNLLKTLWPRVSAVSERLWSPAHVTDIEDAKLRLDQHRCRLIRHGVPASPVDSGFCQEDYNTDNARWHLRQKSTTQHVATTSTTIGGDNTTDEIGNTASHSTGEPLRNLSMTTSTTTTRKTTTTTTTKTATGGNTGTAEESSSQNACVKEIPDVFVSFALIVLIYIISA